MRMYFCAALLLLSSGLSMAAELSDAPFIGAYHTQEPRRERQFFMFPDHTFCYGVSAEGAVFTASGRWQAHQQKRQDVLIELQGLVPELPLLVMKYYKPKVDELDLSDEEVPRPHRWLLTDTDIQEEMHKLGLRLAVSADDNMPLAAAFTKVSLPQKGKLTSILTQLSKDARYLFVQLPRQTNDAAMILEQHQNKIYRFDFGTEACIVSLGFISAELRYMMMLSEGFYGQVRYDAAGQMMYEGINFGRPSSWDSTLAWRQAQQSCMGPVANNLAITEEESLADDPESLTHPVPAVIFPAQQYHLNFVNEWQPKP